MMTVKRTTAAPLMVRPAVASQKKEATPVTLDLAPLAPSFGGAPVPEASDASALTASGTGKTACAACRRWIVAAVVAAAVVLLVATVSRRKK